MAVLGKPPKRRGSSLGGRDKRRDEAATLFISMKGINKKNKAIRAPRDLNRKDRVKGLRGMMLVIPFAMLIILAGGLWLAYSEFIKLNPPAYPTASDYESPDSTDSDGSLMESRLLRLLTVVSLKKALPEDYKIHLTEYEGIQCDEAIVPSLTEMLKAARQEGCNIQLVRGYIDAEEQQNLYEAKVQELISTLGYSQVKAEAEAEKQVAPAGKSEFQTGLLVEFATENGGSFADSREYKWLINHCVDYGFVLRYSKDKEDVTGRSFDASQFRYVGVDNAKKMRTLNMALEEYYTYMKGQLEN